MKKFLIGFAITVAFVVTCIVVLSFANCNRFEIYMNPNVRADQFMLDKKTGQVYRLVVDENQVTMWQEMPIVTMPEYSSNEIPTEE